IIPLLNRPGFYERSIYVNPEDNDNLNRLFPGDAKGTWGQRFAHHLLTEIVVRFEHSIDLHAGDLIEDLTPFVGYRESGDATRDERMRAMANAYGAKWVVKSGATGERPGMMYAVAAQQGVAAILAESGGRARRRADGLRRALLRDEPRDQEGRSAAGDRRALVGGALAGRLDPERDLLGRLGPHHARPRDLPQDLGERRQVEWLAVEGDRADLPGHLLAVREPAHRDDEDRVRARPLAPLSREAGAVEDGQADVEDDQVRHTGRGGPQRVRPVERRRDGEALFAEEFCQ